MKKGDRRRQNKHKRKAVNLNIGQIRRVHKVRKKLRKNPAFKTFVETNPDGTYKVPPELADAMCDMAVLSLLKTMHVSSKSILEVLLPIVSELLEKNGTPLTEIPIGVGMSIGLKKDENEK